MSRLIVCLIVFVAIGRGQQKSAVEMRESPRDTTIRTTVNLPLVLTAVLAGAIAADCLAEKGELGEQIDILPPNDRNRIQLQSRSTRKTTIAILSGLVCLTSLVFAVQLDDTPLILSTREDSRSGEPRLTSIMNEPPKP